MISYGSKFRLIEERFEIHTGFGSEVVSCKPCGTHEHKIEDIARFVRKENGDVLICFKLMEVGDTT